MILHCLGAGGLHAADPKSENDFAAKKATIAQLLRLFTIKSALPLLNLSLSLTLRGVCSFETFSVTVFNFVLVRIGEGSRSLFVTIHSYLRWFNSIYDV